MSALGAAERAAAKAADAAKELPPGPIRSAVEAAAKAVRKGGRAVGGAAASAAAITAKAKGALAAVVKANLIPALVAAVKPVYANAKNLVSSVPNAPARPVQALAGNVQDVNKVAEQIAAALVGTGKAVVQEVAQEQAAELLATSGVPYADDIVGLASGRGGKSPGTKGKEAKAETRSGGSCRTSYDRNSFDGSTPVLMADGSRKPIKDVVVGDKVLAADPTTGESGVRTVTDTRSHKAERLLYEITVSTDSGSGTVVATDEHPFWVESLQKWVNAEDLKPGYTFETADHRPATVAGARVLAPDRQVYNLTVDGLHTYYVGLWSAELAIDLLTHNEDTRDCDTEDERKLYGPFSRAGNPKTQTSETTDLVEESGELWGNRPHGSIRTKPLFKHGMGP